MIREKTYYVYILTNKRNTVFYTGIISGLEERVYQHKHKLLKGFTSKYNINKLVYYEEYNDVYEAIHREKQLKKWRRQWKIDLIKKDNPGLKDLSADWYKDRDSGSSPE